MDRDEPAPDRGAGSETDSQILNAVTEYDG